jgi:hypothetical protein
MACSRVTFTFYCELLNQGRSMEETCQMHSRFNAWPYIQNLMGKPEGRRYKRVTGNTKEDAWIWFVLKRTGSLYRVLWTWKWILCSKKPGYNLPRCISSEETPLHYCIQLQKLLHSMQSGAKAIWPFCCYRSSVKTLLRHLVLSVEGKRSKFLCYLLM